MADRAHHWVPAFRRRAWLWRWPGIISRSPGARPSPPVDPARLARMEAALAAMPDLTRHVFMMHRFDDLAYRRIAARLGITVDDVETHMAWALVRLCRAARASP